MIPTTSSTWACVCWRRLLDGRGPPWLPPCAPASPWASILVPSKGPPENVLCYVSIIRNIPLGPLANPGDPLVTAASVLEFRAVTSSCSNRNGAEFEGVWKLRNPYKIIIDDSSHSGRRWKREKLQNKTGNEWARFKLLILKDAWFCNWPPNSWWPITTTTFKKCCSIFVEYFYSQKVKTENARLLLDFNQIYARNRNKIKEWRREMRKCDKSTGIWTDVSREFEKIFKEIRIRCKCHYVNINITLRNW